MATIAQLLVEEKLGKVSVPLGPGENAMRAMYAIPSAIEWLTLELPQIKSDDFVEGAARPKQHAYEQIRSYIAGDDFSDWMVPKLLRPDCKAVWELRTPDLRFFGWFYKRCVFILSAVGTKARCKSSDLYYGYITQCVFHRDQLDLDPPKYVEGKINDLTQI